MTLDEDPTEENRPDPQFRQTAVSNVQARDIQIGQIVQKIVYLGILPSSPLRPFALVISIALYLTLLIVGFVLLWQDGAGFAPLLLLIVGSGLLSLTCLYYAWFWKPEVQDKSPLIPEGSPAGEQVKRQRTKQRSHQQIRRLAIVGFFLIPLLTCAGFFGWRSLPPPKVLLLVADFDGVDQQKYQVTENILRNLRNATEAYADVKVQALDKSITEQQGSEVARAEGEQKKAAIVIWGDYGVTSDHVQISTHFEVLKPPNYFPELEQEAKGQAQILAIAELNSFKLQTRLSNEMTYLTIFTLGMVQYAEEDWESAIARFSDALGQVNESVPFLGQEAVYFYRGACYYYKRNYKKVIADYTQALELKPSLAVAYNHRGAAYSDQGKYSEAIADYNQALNLKTDYATAYNNRGNAYSNQGKYSEAIADYTLAGAYCAQGVAYDKQGNSTQAIVNYTQVLKLKPALAEAYYNRGIDYYYQGKYTQAIADFNQAIELKPDYADAYNSRGGTYAKHGNSTQSIADYGQALKLKPDFADAYYNRGNAYEKQRNYTQAIADYTQALKLKPDLANAYLNRGNVYSNQGKYTQAIAEYNQAIKLRPNDAVAYYNKACVHSLKREVKEAIENLQRAIQLDKKLRENAKTNFDFDNIRKDEKFQALVGK